MILNGVKYPRLRKQGNAFYYDHGGKPRHWEPLGPDEARALKRYKALADAPKPREGTVDRMLEQTIEALRGKVADGTLENYKGFRKHLAAVFDPDPTLISQADVLRYLRTCPRMSFRGEIAFLSQGFVLWMDEGRLDFNPCFGVKIKRKGSKRTRLLLAAEIDAIVAKADERLAVAIELAYATGLRIGDLCALRWATVQGIFRLQKTDAPTAIEGSAVLDTILARARALQARVGSLYVLCNRRGRKWLPGTLRDHWDAACVAAGVDDAHFHDLRAAAATEVKRRYGQEAAQEFLGHKDARTTLIYLRDRQPNVVRPLARNAST